MGKNRMKTKRLSPLLMGVLMVLFSSKTVGQEVAPVTVPSHSPVHEACLGSGDILLPDSVRIHGISSPRFEGPLCYLAWLPPGKIHPEEKLPVVVLLHGLHGAPSSWLRARWIFEKAMIDGAFPRALVVIPDGRDGYWTDWTDGNHPFGDAVIREYLQDVKRVYPQANLRPEQTVIAGISMGGFGALSLGLLYPDKFGYVVSLSATDLEIATQHQPRRKSYTDPFGRPIDAQAVKRVNPKHLVEQNKGKGQQFWVIYGDKEHRKFSEGGARLIKAMKKKGLKVKERVVSGGRHSWRNTWDDANLYWWIEEVGIALVEGKEATARAEQAEKRRKNRRKAKKAAPQTCRLELWREREGNRPGAFEVHCELPNALEGPCESLFNPKELSSLWPGADIEKLACGPQLDPRAMVLPEPDKVPILYQLQLRRSEWQLHLMGSCEHAGLEPMPCKWTGLLQPPPS
jgi:enterochelin esterase-like enzyme